MIANGLTAVAALVAVLIAWSGLTAWRSQLRGTGEYQLARTALAAAYEVRETLRTVRHPVVIMPGTEVMAGDVDERHRILAGRRRKAYESRWEPVEQAIDRLRAAAMEMSALWGDEAPEVFRDLSNCVWRLNEAINSHLEAQEDAEYRAAYDSDYWRAVNRMVFGRSSDGDEFGEEIDAALKRIAAELRPHIAKA